MGKPNKNPAFTIKHHWDQVEAQCRSDKIHLDLIEILRHAYYSGVSTMIGIDQKLCADPNMSQTDTITILEGICHELQDYMESTVREAQEGRWFCPMGGTDKHLDNHEKK
jgi:hypothetical protein